MTSNRPYLLRAIYDWIVDNNLTPYVLVDATVDGVKVPPQTVNDGKVVLNLAMQAVSELDLGNDRISCKARFSGAGYALNLPLGAVLAIYAQENGQGMMFAEEGDGDTPPPAPPPSGGPTPVADTSDPPEKGGKRGAPHLKVVK